MKLRYSLTSPYVRKVMITAHETGVAGTIELIPTNPWAADTDLPADNPLSKVPTLITATGLQLYDSPVICEYLDSLHGGPKLFPSGDARWAALRRQATADGILDAAVAARVESVMRPAELRWPQWSERQMAAIRRSLAALEGEVNAMEGRFTIGEITVVCALGYLDFRCPQEDWRSSYPKLAAWYARQLDRPSVAATAPHD